MTKREKRLQKSSVLAWTEKNRRLGDHGNRVCGIAAKLMFKLPFSFAFFYLEKLKIFREAAGTETSRRLTRRRSIPPRRRDKTTQTQGFFNGIRLQQALF